MSNNYLTVPDMASADEDEEIVAAEQALERLFRLTMNRKVHSKQTAAVGADVTRGGFAVLRCLAERDERSLGEIARECSMDPAAAGRQVNALEEDGFVARGATTGDGRVTVVRVTPAGRDVYRRVREVRTAYMGEVLADWSARDRSSLTRLVDRLVDDLKAVRFRPDLQEGARR